MWRVAQRFTLTAGRGLFCLSPLLVAAYAGAEPRLSLVTAPLGDTNDGEFGRFVSTAGDFNGDGIDDFIVSQSEWGLNRLEMETEKGRCLVYFGSGSADSLATPDVVFQGVRSRQRFGRWVSHLGDINQDGYSDVVAGTRETGEALVFFGDPTFRGLKLITQADLHLAHPRGGASFLGRAALGLEDLNGDGGGDFAIGANFPLEESGAPEDSLPGEAYVFWGGSQLDSIPDVIFCGSNRGDELGVALAVGDVDGDSIRDIVVGASRYASNDSLRFLHRDVGRVYVWLGATVLAATDTLRPSDADWVFTSTLERGEFGRSVQVSDLNADGFDDVIVGAWQGPREVFDQRGEEVELPAAGEGQVFVFYSALGFSGMRSSTDADIELTGEDDGDNFGQGLSIAGDVDGDGRMDVAIGAPNANFEHGRAYVFLSSSFVGEDHPIEIDAHDAEIMLEGHDVGENFGESVALAGDVIHAAGSDCDDPNQCLPELLIGARDGHAGLSEVGQFSLYSLEFPECSVSVAGLDFGTVNVGECRRRTLVIRNTGGSRSVLTGSFQIAAPPGMPVCSPPGCEFRVTEGGTFALPFDSSLTVGVEFCPLQPTTPVVEVASVLPFGRECSRLAVRAHARPLTFTYVEPSGAVEGEDLELRIVLDDSVASDSAVVAFRGAGQQQSRQTPMAFKTDPGLGNDQYSVKIPASLLQPRSLEYSVTVYRGSASATGPSRGLRFRAGALDLGLQPSGRYRIVSVPLETAATPINYYSDDLGGLDVTRWRLFAYEPDRTRYVEFTNTSPFGFEQGRAYWLISSRGADLDTNQPLEGLTAPADTFAIQLAPGWNMIANPFTFPVSWNSILFDAVAVEAPVAFDPALGPRGDYATQPPSRLLPNEGYFVRNRTNQPTVLRVLPLESASTVASKPAASCDGSSWRVELRATTAQALDAGNVLGVDAAASDAFDVLDQSEPPVPPGPWVRLCFEAGDGQTYRADVRAPSDHVQRWNLVVHTPHEGERALLAGWADAVFPAELSLVLVDLEQHTQLDLRRDALHPSSYTLLSLGPERPYRLQILAGAPAAVAEATSAMQSVPRRVFLGPNSPNPFNPSTRLQFGLPATARVVLEIFAASGRRVVALVPGVQVPAGIHVLFWDGRDAQGAPASSGVYFVRLQAGATSLTHKMLLVH